MGGGTTTTTFAAPKHGSEVGPKGGGENDNNISYRVGGSIAFRVAFFSRNHFYWLKCIQVCSSRWN